MIVERIRWLPVRDARIASLAEGVLLPIRVGDRRLVLVRQRGSLFALADRLPASGQGIERRLGGGGARGLSLAPHAVRHRHRQGEAWHVQQYRGLRGP